MKKILFSLGAALLFFLFAAPVSAKCQPSRDWTKNGKRFWVCVRGDSFNARKRARRTCARIKGSSCGVASTFSSMCSNGRCYTVDGRKHRYLSGY